MLIGFLVTFVLLTRTLEYGKIDNEVVFRSEGTEENPEAAAQYRFDMLRGKLPYVPPLARLKAVNYTKEKLLSKTLNKGKNISSWTALGPGNIGGRVRSLVIRNSNPDEMIIGSVSGGIWKTYDGGEHWEPKNDDGEQIAISCMANIGNIVYAGTGEGWGNADATYGGGIWKSTDFGESWQLLPSTLSNDGWDFKNVRVIRISSSGTVYAVTIAYNRRDNGGEFYDNGGLWKSTDDGESWTKISTSDIANYFNGCDVIPITDEIILFATYQGGIFKTTNGGNSWVKLTSGLPRIADYNRIAMGQDPNNPNIIYAVFATPVGDGLKGIFKTTNGGSTWTQLEDPPRLPSTFMNSYLWNQGWYDNVVTVNPYNSDNIYLGGVEMVRTFDGGDTWEQFAYGYPQFGDPVVHVDYHAIVFHPENPNTIFVCNDGGIYKTTDGGTSWEDLNNNLEITQFYGGAVAYEGEFYQGGTQDNGHLNFSSGTDWEEIYGGDGGYAAIDQRDSKISYEEYVFMSLHKTTDGGITWTDGTNGIDDARDQSKCLFIAPFAMNPDNSDVLIAGSDNVWVTVNGAELWTASSPTLSSGAKISAVSVYNVQAPFLGFAGTTDGKIFKCVDMTGENDTWTEITPPENNGAWVKDIVVNPNDYSEIYAVYSGYNNDGVFPTKHVWYSDNQGENWRDISGDLPDIPVYSLLVNPSDSQTLYIGTETGVYQTINRGENWVKAGSGMPDFVPVYDLVMQQATNKIFAFTHGRGVFVSATPLPVELTTFTATVHEQSVVLHWETQTEVNSFGFEIERKSEKDSEWKNIGYIGGKGNSNGKQSYEFTDYPEHYGILSYRLKQIDNDGAFSYSDILDVEFYAANKFELLQNYPNPFNPTTTIKYTIPQINNVETLHATSLQIYNILGEEIATLVNERQAPGNYTVQFDASDLPSGTYFYTLRVGNFVATRKMILLK